MHETTRQLVAAASPPVGQSTRALTERAYATLEGLDDLIAEIQTDIAMIERARRTADAQEDDPSVWNKFERLKQKNAVLLQCCAELGRIRDRLTDTLYQRDQHAVAMGKTGSGPNVHRVG